MNLERRMRAAAFLSIGMLAALTAGAQDFGAAKERVLLQRKLPALVHVTGTSFKVRATAHSDQTELLKDDPHLRADERAPSAVITCQITAYSHPPPTVSTKPGLDLKLGVAMNQSYKRVTGSLNVSFQARGAD